ncbi:MAG: DegT/DnrJ/EryC1/StrS family aminotransferase, partial [Cyanobacteria bacterium J06598_3]
LTLSSRTTALHLALLAYDIGLGDEVIVPDITFIATANAVAYTGAKPVFVDIDSETLCLDVEKAKAAITPRTKAIIAVHLYGHPANMPALKAIAQPQGIALIEDAAEAHGATIKGKRTGALGDCGVFSFYGNKIVTCGEGGMITTNNTDFYERAKFLRSQAMSSTQRYWHTEVGYNYRMTNLQAALGFAQMKRIDEFVQQKKTLFSLYEKHMVRHPNVRLNRSAPWAENVFWQVCMEVEGWTAAERDRFMLALAERGIDTRPYFYPISDMPMYVAGSRHKTPVAHQVSQQGLNLPSYFEMSEREVMDVCAIIGECLDQDILQHVEIK